MSPSSGPEDRAPESGGGFHVVVLGGGVAGLVTAWRLAADPELGQATPTAQEELGLRRPALERKRHGLRVTVVESRARFGGNIRSQEDGGFLIEWGPNGFLDNAPETPRLCRLLGIEDRVVPARDAAARRFLFVRGRLRPLPLSAASFFVSSVLTVSGRLRVLGEPFIPARPDPDESVFQFAARRIGPEAARTLVDAMVSGVYGGDSRQLCLSSAFPKMHAMEKEYGGLVRAMLGRMRERRRERKAERRALRTAELSAQFQEAAASDAGGVPHSRAAAASDAGGVPHSRAAAASDAGHRKSDSREVSHPPGDRKIRKGSTAGPAGPGGVLTSFDRGMEVLIETLAAALQRQAGCDLLSGSPAIEVIPDAAGWKILLENGRRLEADAVILALPSRHAGALVRSFDPALCSVLQSIPEAPLVVVGLAWPESALTAPIDGFGFLIPRGQGPRSLGVLWDSSIYPGRAPEGSVLMRAMIGGAQDPGAFDLSDDEVLAQVRRDLSMTMDLDAPPATRWILRHPHGIPQYTIGHPARLATIHERRASWRGLYFTGNSYRGISVNHCVEESIAVAREVLTSVRAIPG